MLSPSEFARLLDRAAVRAETELSLPTEELMVEVEREAKALIGTYDAGWPELAESTKADRVRKGFAADEPLLRSGALRDSIQHETHATAYGAEGLVFSDDPIAIYQEIGTSRIPPRPFLGPSLTRCAPHASEIFGAFAVRIMTE